MKQTYICNGCGKKINANRKDFLRIEKEWGYFSEKDMEIHEICLCEECYDKWLSSFKIPVKVTEVTEAL